MRKKGKPWIPPITSQRTFLSDPSHQVCVFLCPCFLLSQGPNSDVRLTKHYCLRLKIYYGCFIKKIDIKHLKISNQHQWHQSTTYLTVTITGIRNGVLQKQIKMSVQEVPGCLLVPSLAGGAGTGSLLVLVPVYSSGYELKRSNLRILQLDTPAPLLPEPFSNTNSFSFPSNSVKLLSTNFIALSFIVTTQVQTGVTKSVQQKHKFWGYE